MPDVEFPIHVLRVTLDGGLLLGEALTLPLISRLARRPDRLGAKLVDNLTDLLPKLAPLELHRHAAPAAVEIDTLRVDLAPPPKFPAWRGELTLSFPFVRWQHGDAWLAFVPALGLQVAANRPEELAEQLPTEVRAALQRGKMSASLRQLVQTQRALKLECERLSVTVDLPTLKRRALSARREADEKKSVLDQVGVNLGKASNPVAYRMRPTVDQLCEALTGRAARSVLLVGPSGVGKTAAFRQLVRERRQRQLGHTPFYATSGSRLVAGQCGYGMWQQRCREVCREAAKRKAILHLGNLVELMDVGKSEGNPSGLASFLRPFIARGEVLAVAECTPEQVPLIEREDPQLIDAFLQLTVPEPGPEDSRTILQLFAYDQPPGRRQALSAEVLDVTERLHRRYATYSAFPGRPLRFLQNLLNDAAVDTPLAVSRSRGKSNRSPRDENGTPPARNRKRRIELPDPPPPRPLTTADIYDAFTRETGLPRVLLDPAQRLDLGAAADWFGARVIGQSEPVGLVTDLIGTVKAGLARPDRPIASLLFIGPTGVGKTEMAKALAEYLFGSPHRLTRFDMSEYGDPVAVQRLVGTAFGAEGLLTAKVREQPFSVILLDEFEKAHPAFFDLLLQMLGEGRLTDAAGRLADFRNSVIILTSNLGAESYQAGKVGFGPTASGFAPDAKDHFTREVQAFLRPEMFNRIDRVVAFAPLPPDVVRRIAQRQLDLIRRRDGVRYRGLDLAIDDAVAARLGETGFDARYGARPLKRAIERQLLAPLAERVNEYSALNALSARVALEGGALAVTVKPRSDSQGRPVPAQAALPEVVKVAHEAVELRRMYQRVERCWATMDFRNELFQLDRREKHWLRLLERAARRPGTTQPKHPLGPIEQSKLARLRELGESLDTQARRCREIEEEAQLILHGPPGAPPADLTRLRAERIDLEKGWWDLLLTLYCRTFPESGKVSLALFSEERAALFALAEAYVSIADQRKWRVEMLRYQLPGPPPGADAPELLLASVFGQGDSVWHRDTLYERKSRQALLQRRAVPNPRELLASADPRVLGLALRIEGQAVFPRFAGEDGLHVFAYPNHLERVLVQTSDAELSKLLPPEGVTRKGALAASPRRRGYDMAARVLEDPQALASAWPASEGFTSHLAGVLEETMREKMLGILDE